MFIWEAVSGAHLCCLGEAQGPLAEPHVELLPPICPSWGGWRQDWGTGQCGLGVCSWEALLDNLNSKCVCGVVL